MLKSRLSRQGTVWLPSIHSSRWLPPGPWSGLSLFLLASHCTLPPWLTQVFALESAQFLVSLPGAALQSLRGAPPPLLAASPSRGEEEAQSSLSPGQACLLGGIFRRWSPGPSLHTCPDSGKSAHLLQLFLPRLQLWSLLL